MSYEPIKITDGVTGINAKGWTMTGYRNSIQVKTYAIETLAGKVHGNPTTPLTAAILSNVKKAANVIMDVTGVFYIPVKQGEWERFISIKMAEGSKK